MGSENIAAAPAGETVIVDETGLGRFQVEARVATSAFLIDEPVAAGGLGSGPNPFDLLSAALGSCTAMTLRLYAERKAWPLAHVQVRVTHHRSALHARDIFKAEIFLEGELDETQRGRLIEIAQRCPVHLTLERGCDVEATIAVPAERLNAASPPGAEHMRTMTQACDN